MVTAKQRNLLIEAWWPHKAGPWPKFLGQLRQRSFSGCSPQYEINEIPVTWLIVLLGMCERMAGPAAFHSRRGAGFLPLPASKPLHPSNPPAGICSQTGGRVMGQARARASAAEWGLCRRIGHGRAADGRPCPSVQHHQRRGDAKYISPATLLTQKNRTDSTTFIYRGHNECKVCVIWKNCLFRCHNIPVFLHSQCINGSFEF